MGERTFNHRRRLQKIAKKHGVDIANVRNWHDLADRLESHLGIKRKEDVGPRRFAYDVMEALGWVKRLEETRAWSVIDGSARGRGPTVGRGTRQGQSERSKPAARVPPDSKSSDRPSR